MDSPNCNSLLSWDAGVRSVWVCYADKSLSGRIENVEGWVVVQADPDGEVRCVGGLERRRCGVWVQISETFLIGSFYQGHWVFSLKISCGPS